ncbi:MAG: aldo/keto reductase [Candidatus Krumholzibacteria bacterium]|nr:aldo/keto reductase [Candidatus Krumholzibacteria bacterium]
MAERITGITRRDFMATAAAGIVGAGLAGIPAGRTAAQESPAPADTSQRRGGRIITRVLGKTGLELPIVGMGVMTAENPEVVRAAYGIGVRYFDTAAVYQGGKNEEMVGRVIEELGVRDEVVIATKIYAPDTRRGDAPADTRRKMLAQIDECLGRLRTDHVDILYVHSVDSAELVADEAIHGAMEEIRRSGKTRFTGVSTHKNMPEVISAVAGTGRYDVVLTVINVTMADYADLIGAIRAASKAGVGIVAMKTQAGGRRFPLPAETNEYSGSIINTASLKWVLRMPEVHTAIPGFTSFEHMREDFSVAYGLEYTEEEKCLLRDCDLKTGLGFCRQCGACVASCPAGADIPAMMRAHMYAAQYSDFARARDAYREIERGRGVEACRSCGNCRAVCPHAVGIARRIDDLRLLYA